MSVSGQVCLWMLYGIPEAGEILVGSGSMLKSYGFKIDVRIFYSRIKK